MSSQADSPRNPDAEEIRRLADELDATPEQIEEAIVAVGRRRSDIVHLKGARSTIDSDRVRDAGG